MARGILYESIRLPFFFGRLSISIHRYSSPTCLCSALHFLNLMASLQWSSRKTDERRPGYSIVIISIICLLVCFKTKARTPKARRRRLPDRRTSMRFGIRMNSKNGTRNYKKIGGLKKKRQHGISQGVPWYPSLHKCKSADRSSPMSYTLILSAGECDSMVKRHPVLR